MEDIKQKLDLLNLSEKERSIAIEKFLVTLSVIDYDNLKAIADLLQSKGMSVTKAREIKVGCNDYSEIVKRFDIMESINEAAVYREDIMRLNINAIDIFKKIKYCMQVNRPYKREDGSYEPFLFNEVEWQKAFNRDSASVEVAAVPLVNDEKVEIPMATNEALDKAPDKEVVESPIEEESFAKIRSELEGLQSQLAALDSLDSLNNSYETEIGFNDIEPEVYRRAA